MTQQKIAAGVACLWLLVGHGPEARAQTVVSSFGELAGTLKPGKTVYVTDEAGRKVKGRLVDLSGSSLTLLGEGDRQTFRDVQVRQLTEQRRNTGKGALFGLGAGAGFGLLVGLSCSEFCGPAAPLVAAIAMGGVGAGIGAAIGAATTHERLVYRGPTPHPETRIVVAPWASKHGIGLAGSVRF